MHNRISFEAHAAIRSLEGQCELIESPLHRVEHYLHPWVSFLVMPIFAFANAGVQILGNVRAAAKHPISLGVVLKLFIGKPVGIWFFAWVSAKLRLGTPSGGSLVGKILGAGSLCGIGFTMYLFIATLAFGDGALLDMSKIGMLVASLAAGTYGSIFLLRQAEPRLSNNPAQREVI